MRRLVLGLVVGFFGLAFAPHAAAETAPTPEQLIDQLAGINCNGPGLYSHFPYEDFWAVVPDPNPKWHLEGRKPDCVPDAMRALVRLGAAALPALVRHVSDTRSTHLRVGFKVDPEKLEIGGQIFGTEYDSRAHAYKEEAFAGPFVEACKGASCAKEASFWEPYTIRVGDVCFTIIGQIVNRELVAARYQPTAIVIVNSPIQQPWLAEQVSADWSDVDAEGLRDALLADLHTPLRPAPPGYKPRWKKDLPYEEREAGALERLYAGALRRLRFYYPGTYAALTGDDLAKRQEFEQQEAKRYAGYPERPPEELIDDLTSINCRLSGVTDTTVPVGFLAQNGSMEDVSSVLFEQVGKYRSRAFCNDTSVRNVMAHGLTELPALIRHLDDKRPTKLVIGKDLRRGTATEGTQFFAEEYNPRHQVWPMTGCIIDGSCENKRPFTKPYRVKVGDICFVLIGQIVNRELNAVRYQPTAIVMVNSPVETPALAARVRADWSGIDSEGVRNSLLADLHATKLEGAPDASSEAAVLERVHSGALLRLRYYFPDAYASLTGADLEKRAAFEKAEREATDD